MDPLTLLGQKELEVQTLRMELRSFIGLVQQIKLGKVSIDRLKVNDDFSWSLLPEGFSVDAPVPAQS